MLQSETLPREREVRRTPAAFRQAAAALRSPARCLAVVLPPAASLSAAVGPAASLPAGVGLSIGCAEVDDKAENVMALIKRADERMYENKRLLRRARPSAGSTAAAVIPTRANGTR